jgi:hypothetical protein
MRLRARTTIGSRGGLEMSKKKQEKKTQKKRITFKLEAFGRGLQQLGSQEAHDEEGQQREVDQDCYSCPWEIRVQVPRGWAMAE